MKHRLFAPSMLFSSLLLLSRTLAISASAHSTRPLGHNIAAGSVRSTERTTRLGIEGTKFTINGKPAFLLGISMYGALGESRENLRKDLADIRRHRFNWIRVWATWTSFGTDVSAIDSNGNAIEPYLGNLKWLVGECDRLGIVVDVTLSRGDGSKGSPNLETLEAHTRAVQTVESALHSYRNWYIDLSNERNIGDKRFTSVEDLKALRDLVKQIDPNRLVTASHGGDIEPKALRDYLLSANLDFVCPHRPRDRTSPEATEEATHGLLAAMDNLRRAVPVHYQEPFRRGYADWKPGVEDFLADLRGAISEGAAGWCLHNGSQRGAPESRPRRSFDLRDRRLFDQLDAVELAVAAKAADTLRSAHLSKPTLQEKP